MSLLAPLGGSWRPPQIGKAAILSPYKGMLRAQKWPRKRGLPKDPKQRARLEWFRIIQAWTKLLREVEIKDMREALKEHNRTHRGQRGSAAIRFRDWTHQRLAGRGFAVSAPNGVIFYPPAVKRTTSKIMDHAAHEPASVLTRNQGRWDRAPDPLIGSVLTAGPPGEPARFKPLPP